jgi:hypothetical protein
LPDKGTFHKDFVEIHGLVGSADSASFICFIASQANMADAMEFTVEKAESMQPVRSMSIRGYHVLSGVPQSIVIWLICG